VSAIAIDPLFGDFAFSGGNMQMVASNSIAECAQELNARLNFAQGEWFMDTQQGFPYRSAVLVKNPDMNVIATLYRSMFIATPGVDSVTSFAISFAGASRVLTWVAQIKHASGNYITGGYGQPFVVASQVPS
jgi:hypothetical protein